MKEEKKKGRKEKKGKEGENWEEKRGRKKKKGKKERGRGIGWRG